VRSNLEDTFRLRQVMSSNKLSAPEAHTSVLTQGPSTEALRQGERTPVVQDRAGPTLTSVEMLPDLSRSAFCVLGIPIDAISMATVVQRMEAAAADRAAFLISTPNLNFLVSSRSDPEFRETLLDSDLCPPDGMPIVWIGRLIGIPIKERVAGADILDWLRATGNRTRRLTVFLFGGAEGVAAAAARTLNAEPGGLNCVGTIDPGFGTVSEMSQDHTIDAINSSNADFLAVSLGAKKGQFWLQRNHERLTIPIRAHLGAALNFQAGTIKRAPRRVRAWGLEWLWRIKEEPHLWRRYWNDGSVLLRLLLTRVLPLTIATQWCRLRYRYQTGDLLIETTQDHQSAIIALRGVATEQHVETAISCFREVLATKQKIIVVDVSATRVIDARFFGLLLMLRKQLKRRGATLIFTGVSHQIERMFRLNELGFLLHS
jgi:N-acetylglucosaminyldiphosphoundecaprenol N-acetyl-beta-D-mannosaminyltransferase